MNVILLRFVLQFGSVSVESQLTQEFDDDSDGEPDPIAVQRYVMQRCFVVESSAMFSFCQMTFLESVAMQI